VSTVSARFRSQWSGRRSHDSRGHRFPFPAVVLPGSNLGQVVHTHTHTHTRVYVTKHYTYVISNRRSRGGDAPRAHGLRTKISTPPTLLVGYGTLAYVYLTLTRRQMSGGGSKCPVTCWRWPLVDTEDGGHQHSFVLSPAVLSNRLLPAPSITHVHGSTAQLL